MRESERMASIEEVAREAGVSITTVSHVFSGKRPVAPETRRRVLAVAERLDYRPHRAARGLATGRTLTIGLHLPFVGDRLVPHPFVPELLEGLSAAAGEAGYGFLLIPASPEARFPLQRALKEGRFDGVIAADPTEDDLLILSLLRRGLPLVTAGGRYLRPARVPWVDHDHRGGLAELMAHLEERPRCGRCSPSSSAPPPRRTAFCPPSRFPAPPPAAAGRGARRPAPGEPKGARPAGRGAADRVGSGAPPATSDRRLRWTSGEGPWLDRWPRSPSTWTAC